MIELTIRIFTFHITITPNITLTNHTNQETKQVFKNMINPL